jgi:8-oxo-dGTP pyrophosphatase MutT (NUDIX family)
VPDILQFGEVVANADYVLRPGGYSVIFNAEGRIAVVETPDMFALPGGGQDPGEPAATAALREAREECELAITLSPLLGVADELAFAHEEHTYYRKRCTFFLAQAENRGGKCEPGYTLHWFSPDEALTRLDHGSQSWAVAEAIRVRGGS